MFQVLYSPNEPVHILGSFSPGSGSASVHVDLDPGGIPLCGSVRIRIQNTGRDEALFSCSLNRNFGWPRLWIRMPGFGSV